MPLNQRTLACEARSRCNAYKIAAAPSALFCAPSLPFSMSFWAAAIHEWYIQDCGSTATTTCCQLLLDLLHTPRRTFRVCPLVLSLLPLRVRLTDNGVGIAGSVEAAIA
eukprot:6177245-Pleurochrysis_carterae.AAC.3